MIETFTCDYCRKVLPVTQRHTTKAATLNPYPEDLHLCTSCDSDNDADLHEIHLRRQEIEEQRREEGGLY